MPSYSYMEKKPLIRVLGPRARDDHMLQGQKINKTDFKGCLNMVAGNLSHLQDNRKEDLSKADMKDSMTKTKVRSRKLLLDIVRPIRVIYLTLMI